MLLYNSLIICKIKISKLLSSKKLNDEKIQWNTQYLYIAPLEYKQHNSKKCRF